MPSATVYPQEQTMQGATDLLVQGNTSGGTDLLVFGATGFTGRQTVFRMAAAAQEYGLTWAVAGRSREKLQSLLSEATEKTGVDHSKIPIVVADVDDDASLLAMCQATKVVVNCCGPYRLYGEAVVKAAVAAKAHYVDVSGETQFIDNMTLKYGEVARDAGVYVVNACGFDSIPNDVGVMFLRNNFDGVLNSVESYLSGQVAPEYYDESRKTGTLNYGTWESLVRGVNASREMEPLRKKMFPTPLPTFQPKMKQRGIHNRFNSWYIPFLGSDEPIVYCTQRYNHDVKHERPIQFKTYIQVGGFFSLLSTSLAAGTIFILAQTQLTMKWLLNCPRVFSLRMVSRGGPSEAVMNNTYYQFELLGEGWEKGQDLNTPPKKQMRVKVSGMNPGYGATVHGLIQSAITILLRKDKMPAEGGVMTTGVAFANTDLTDRLSTRNMKFEIINDSDNPK